MFFEFINYKGGAKKWNTILLNVRFILKELFLL